MFRVRALSDRPDEAIPFFLQAWDAAPYSIPVLMTGARAFYRTGRIDDADAVFEALLEISESVGQDSDLAAYLAHGHDLETMADDIPALRELYLWLDRIGGAS